MPPIRSTKNFTRNRVSHPYAPPSINIIFTVARMNPPTKGHMKIIENIILDAVKNHEEKVYIILSHTTGEIKNPLSCADKRSVLEKMIEANFKNYGVEVKIICGDDPINSNNGKMFIISQLSYIMKQLPNRPGSEMTLRLFIGEDRYKATDGKLVYGWVEGAIQKKFPGVKLKLDITPEPRPAGAISGTYMRGLIEANKEDEFIEREMDAGLTKVEAKNLYDLLKELLTDLGENPSKKSKTSKSVSAKSASAKSAKKAPSPPHSASSTSAPRSPPRSATNTRATRSSKKGGYRKRFKRKITLKRKT